MRLPVYYPAARLARGGYGSGERDYPPCAPTRSATAPRSATTPTGSSLYAGDAGQYYGVQGTSWKSPPILDSPTETEKMRGRKYEMFYDGDRLRLVAWRTPRGAYWVSNTLSAEAHEQADAARSRGR